jgi:hypothetical protein
MQHRSFQLIRDLVPGLTLPTPRLALSVLGKVRSRLGVDISQYRTISSTKEIWPIKRACGKAKENAFSVTYCILLQPEWPP